MARTRSTGSPVAAPPAGGQGNGGGAGGAAAKPLDLTAEQLAGLTGATAAVAGSSPALAPPGAEAGVGITGAGAVTGTWLADKRVSALWNINQVRNGWAYVVGIGWKKLFNASDSSNTAMTMLASHAKQTNSRFDYREEADGMIHEIYIW